MIIFKEFLEIYGLFTNFPVIWKLSDPSKTNVQPFLHTNYKKKNSTRAVLFVSEGEFAANIV